MEGEDIVYALNKILRKQGYFQIDIDVSPSDRDRVYEYIINRFGQEKTAYILAIGTIKSKGCIDEIVRALGMRWNKDHLEDEKPVKDAIKTLRAKQDSANKESYFVDIHTGDRVLVATLDDEQKQRLIKEYNELHAKMKEKNEELIALNPYTLKFGDQVKKEFESNENKAREKYPQIFYYYDGLLDVAVSQSMHPAGIVASPVTLPDNYGAFYSDDRIILQIDMECVHEVSLVKYDILGLKNIEIIKDAYKLIGKPYPKSHEINWCDDAVWRDMLRSPVGIFQFEGAFAFEMLRKYQPKSIFDMSLVTAALRPSGASYRDDLMAHKPHSNPSPIIDELLADNNGYLIYQEDVIKFLQQICGFSGSDADNTRRAIGRKDEERLQKALPQILEGYCSKSPQPREVAEEEAKEFLRIIEDASSYMFGYNHSIGYCMIGYLCAYLRYYYPYEFITSYLNNAHGDEDIQSGSELAEIYNVKIVPPKFGVSKDEYMFDKERGVIAKGVSSVKYLNAVVANKLYDIAADRPFFFMDLLTKIDSETTLNSRQREVLIKIDYFSDYGNPRKLLRIIDFFEFFKRGTAKKFPKSKANEEFTEIIAPYVTDTTKSGIVSNYWTITDMPGLLRACEMAVNSMNIQDFDMKTKMGHQLEHLGYIDLTTGLQSDRKKLLVQDVYPLVSKEKGECWGHAVIARSIGSGKTARLTVRSRVFNMEPLRKLDIILAGHLEQNRAGYWYLNSYKKIL